MLSYLVQNNFWDPFCVPKKKSGEFATGTCSRCQSHKPRGQNGCRSSMRMQMYHSSSHHPQQSTSCAPSVRRCFWWLSSWLWHSTSELNCTRQRRSWRSQWRWQHRRWLLKRWLAGPDQSHSLRSWQRSSAKHFWLQTFCWTRWKTLTSGTSWQNTLARQSQHRAGSGRSTCQPVTMMSWMTSKKSLKKEVCGCLPTVLRMQLDEKLSML